MDLQLYIAELVIAAPISILASIGLSKFRRWGMIAALIATGVYLYGSVLVYASVLITGFPYPLKLVVPPIFGIGLSITAIIWIKKNFDHFR